MICPKCKQELKAAGEVNVDGEKSIVYQCDQCTKKWSFDGETFDVALSFAVDASGRLLDPETLEPLNLN